MNQSESASASMVPSGRSSVNALWQVMPKVEGQVEATTWSPRLGSSWMWICHAATIQPRPRPFRCAMPPPMLSQWNTEQSWK